MLRDLRRADGPALFALMERGFPEESALMGSRPEEFERVFRRIFRWDSRLILGLLSLLGRPIVQPLVVEADGRAVAMALVTFPRGAAYVSSVVVDEAYRRRGYAKRMLEAARRAALRAHREYIALDVLDTNTRARTLYETIGYRPLRRRTQVVHESPASFGAAAPSAFAIRPFRRSDARPLVDLVRRQTREEVWAVTPLGERSFQSSRFVARMMLSEEASWVIDRGRGPEGHVAANVAETMEAGHMSAPVLAESVEPDLRAALVGTAGAFCAARGVVRILSLVADDNETGRAALDAAGFRPALALSTLYRRVAE